MKEKRIYLKNERILSAMIESKKLGSPTAEYAECCKMIAENLIKGRSFHKYSKELKEDMIGNALLRSMMAIRTFDEKKTSNAWGYVTRTAYCAFLQVLNEHYKNTNIKRDILKMRMLAFDSFTGKNMLEDFERDTWEGCNYE